MKEYTIKYSKQSLKYLLKQNRLLKEKIEKELILFSFWKQVSSNIKLLLPKSDWIYRMRIWKYRVIFKNEDNLFLILILKIWSRWDIYK